MVALWHFVRATAAVASVLPVDFYNAFGGTNVKAYIMAHDANGRYLLSREGMLVVPGMFAPAEEGLAARRWMPATCAALVSSRTDDTGRRTRMLHRDRTWIDSCALRTGAPGVQILPADAITHHLGVQGAVSNLDLPVPMKSGRMYFVTDGDLEFGTTGPPVGGNCPIQEPSALNAGSVNAHVSWAFMEFSSDGDLVFANPTLVDFVGAPLSLRMDTPDRVLEAKGLPADIVDVMCSDLAAKAQEEPGVAWDKLCVRRQDGSVLRVLSPQHYTEADLPILETYYDAHVNAVWDKYRSTPMVMDTQSPQGKVLCQVQGDALVCRDESFAKPTSSDIFGCNSGPFANQGTPLRVAVSARLCAAFNRGTCLVEGGDQQPAGGVEKYYQKDPANWYAYLVHKHGIDGDGYAFPFDDVTASGKLDRSGTLSHANATKLTIGVGGPLP